MNEPNSPLLEPQDSALAADTITPSADVAVQSPDDSSLLDAIRHVLQIAVPLMISTGTASIVLFADRTLLLYYGDGSHMSAAMAGGNMYWTLVCFPIGIASMTGAIVAQYIGSGRPNEVGRFLWQSAWLAALAIPFFAFIAWIAPWVFRVTGQTEALIPLATTYLRILMLGAVGSVLDTGLSGFFSGTQRTRVIMWSSLMAGLVNLVLDYWFIFGGLGLPAMGIAGAAIASVVAFWIKAIFYIVLLFSDDLHRTYATRCRAGLDAKLIGKLLYFGSPAGLQHLAEAGGFTTIILQIGQLGDIPLRATTMAANFNLIAFIPMVGIGIAASVLVGHHLTESGPQKAIMINRAALIVGWVYSLVWVVLCFGFPEWLLSLYAVTDASEETMQAMSIARTLLGFVGIYVLFDATQLIVAGTLRGAGDTWFVLIAASSISICGVAVGILGKNLMLNLLPISELHWWWAVITAWVLTLAVVMVLRYWSGRWQSMRMVS